MTDLEELFRPLIDDGAQHRVPVEAIELRARDYTARQRGRQRAQYGLVAGVVAVAVVAAGVGIVRARDNGTGRAGPAVTTASPANATTPIVPPGWVSYDYGLARLSVPPDFTAVSGNGCGAPDGPLLELQTTADSSEPVCGHPPAVELSPISGPNPHGLAGSVNGIDYIAVPAHCPPDATPPSTSSPSTPVCEPSFWVPALGIDIFFEFTHADNVADIDAILDTLTYSTYARVVQHPFGTAPASWKTIDLGGYVGKVPPNWDVVRVTNYCGPAANTAYREFAPISKAECPPPGALVATPRDSAYFVRADDAQVADSAPVPPGSVVVRHNGLRFARTPDSGGVVNAMHFTIDAPHGRFEVTLTLGLDPTVARGILGSLKMPGS